MRYLFLLEILLASLFVVGAGCAKEACPEGQSLIDESCCNDADVNGLCDSSQIVEQETPETTPETTEEEVAAETGYFWDTAKVSITKYVCTNSSISISLKNSLPNSISIEKAKLGTTFGKGLPILIEAGTAEDVDFRNPLLIKGKTIGQSLLIEYKDRVKKETIYLGPAKVEGIC